jgi:hypothetical protein
VSYSTAIGYFLQIESKEIQVRQKPAGNRTQHVFFCIFTTLTGMTIALPSPLRNYGLTNGDSKTYNLPSCVVLNFSKYICFLYA